MAHLAQLLLVLLAAVPGAGAGVHHGQIPRSQIWRWELYRIPDSVPEFRFAEGKWRQPDTLDTLGMATSAWKERDEAFEAEGLFCNGRWLGVQVLQGPEDLMYLQQVIVKLRPGIIIETGTYRGGLAFFAASVLSQLGLRDSRVITMDPFDVDSNFHNLDNHPLCPVCLDCVKAHETELWRQHVIFFQGNSLRLQEQVVRMISELRSSGTVGPVLVTLDAQHSFDATLTELHLYAGLADVGSYVVLQDARLDVTYGRPGPMTAGARLLQDEPPQWVWDRDVEVFGHTQHLWLRRIALGPPVALTFSVMEEDLVSKTPFRLRAEGSRCAGADPLKEIDWAGSLLACQAICLRVPEDGCWYFEFFDRSEPPLCVLWKDCPELRSDLEAGALVYERLQ